MNFVLFMVVMLAVAATMFLAGGRTIALCLPAFTLLALGAFLAWWPRRNVRIPRAHGECLAAALTFAGYIAVRALFSPEEYLARKDLFLALGGLTLYLIVALNLTSSRWRVALATGLLVLAVANCTVGAAQYFTHRSLTSFHLLLIPDVSPRVSGFYGYPNHLAVFLEISLMLAVSMAFWGRWPAWAKLLWGYAALVCLAGIIATGSRGGYIACTVGLLVFGLLSLVLVGKLAPGRVIGVLLVGLLLIAGVAWGFRAMVSKNSQLNWRATNTLTIDATRMRLWQAAWKQFRLQPAFGTGSGTYLYYGRQFRSPAVQTDPVHAHNDYFELLAEYGIAGIIAAVIFLETHLRMGWTIFRRRISGREGHSGLASNSLALNVAALSAAAACLVYCLLDFSLHMGANVLLVAFVFALLASPSAGPEGLPAEERERGFPAILRLVLPALGLCMVLRVLPSAGADFYAERCRIVMSDWHFTASPEVARQLQDFAERGLKYDSRNPELYYALGAAFISQADLATSPADKDRFEDRAITAFGNAMDLAPRDVNYLLDKAGELDEVKRFAESDPLYRRALELDPKSGRVLNAVAGHLEVEGKFPEAIEKYREAMRLGGDMIAQSGLDRIAKAQKAKEPAAAPGPERSDLR